MNNEQTGGVLDVDPEGTTQCSSGRSLVIYHANCCDGFCAAWLINRHMTGCEFHAAHYGTEPPDVDGRHVIMVDFSYPRAVMLSIALRSASLVVLDHHKSAQKELDGLKDNLPVGIACRVVFDMSKSGARLAHEWLHGPAVPPCDLVDYVEDRDLWKFALLCSREINAAIRSYPMTFESWDRLYRMMPDVYGTTGYTPLAGEGKAILRYQNEVAQHHVKHAVEAIIGGHKVLAVNATTLFSEISGELAKGRPFGACYFDRFDGKRQWSLRSDEQGVDVSEVARIFGGGGHPRAAGFETHHSFRPWVGL